MSNIVYEYIFLKTFDEAVFNQGPITDDNDFLNKIKESAELNGHVLDYNPGIPSLTSLVEYNGSTYKVTVKRS